MSRPKGSKNKAIMPEEQKIEQEQEQNIELKELISGMREIVSAVKDISLRVSKMENEMTLPKEPPKEEEIKQAQITEDSVFPIPIDYRKAVEEKLNKKFGVKVEPNDNLPSFRFTILVPKEYSPLNNDEWQMHGGVDRRPKIVSMSEGINGVNEWIEKVYNNFDAATKARIQSDKLNL